MFEHSVKVPRLYKVAAKILQQTKEEGGHLKQLVYQSKHSNIKAIYALVVEALKHFSDISTVIDNSELLVKEKRCDQWLARILITELLWRGKQLSSNCKPVQIILSYYDALEKCKLELDSNPTEQTAPQVQKPRFVRINTLAITVQEAIDGFYDDGWRLLRLPSESYDEYLSKIATLNSNEFMIDLHIKELLLFPVNTQFYNHRAYKKGLIVLQDKASCLSAVLLNPPPGSTVLDMCAAPGMKTTHVAALLNNEGTVYAVERDENRFKTLNKIVETVGATCVKTIHKDVLAITEKDCPNVEYILVDPSCTGSGMTERVVIDGKIEEADSQRLRCLSRFQILILKHALTHFSSAKRVVYSTCSIYPQENEYVVQEVLNRTNQFKLIPASDLLNGPWKNSIGDDYNIIDKCLYTKPEKDLTNGFFIAVFERNHSQNNFPKETNRIKYEAQGRNDKLAEEEDREVLLGSEIYNEVLCDETERKKKQTVSSKEATTPTINKAYKELENISSKDSKPFKNDAKEDHLEEITEPCTQKKHKKKKHSKHHKDGELQIDEELKKKKGKNKHSGVIFGGPQEDALEEEAGLEIRKKDRKKKKYKEIVQEEIIDEPVKTTKKSKRKDGNDWEFPEVTEKTKSKKRKKSKTEREIN